MHRSWNPETVVIHFWLPLASASSGGRRDTLWLPQLLVWPGATGAATAAAAAV